MMINWYKSVQKACDSEGNIIQEKVRTLHKPFHEVRGGIAAKVATDPTVTQTDQKSQMHFSFYNVKLTKEPHQPIIKLGISSQVMHSESRRTQTT